ncbi:MAG: hypothetical protein NTY46_10455, partial [Candidatus Sumerlaeota bacterium]|nr:hypothetical protein [Candidatus Sumerlaeota bacterium]
YVGGDFTSAGGVSASNVAKWNGSSWSALGSGIGSHGYVRALAVIGSDVYVGGNFMIAGETSASCVAKWNGSSWSALGTGMNGTVLALAVIGSDLYVGGNFSTAGGVSANRVAKWNGSSWLALGSGMNGPVRALAVIGNDLYVGGYFTAVGEVYANYIAKWNGSSWSALGSGMNNAVYALAVSGSDLYAGGAFTMAGGVSANCVAKWDGSSWSALGSGMNYVVSALAVNGSDLYVGGDFSTAGGVSANRVAKWNGSSWLALGSGIGSPGYVNALAVIGSDLYVGGNFTMAAGNRASHIAKWNGSSWSALGSGMGGQIPYVNALAVSGSDLYVGGNFSTAGGVSANRIAKWNGSFWSALGSGMGDPYNVYYRVCALAVSGSDLYVGGDFTRAGEVSANRIAKWNGSSWSALGSGMGYYPFWHEYCWTSWVYALAVSGSDLYVGGDFGTAGGKPSSCIARWFAAAFGPSAIFTKAYDDNTGVRTYPPEGYSEGGSFHVGPASGVDAAYDYFGNGFSSGWLAMAFNAKETSPPVRLLAAYDDETGAARPIPAGYAQQGAFHISQGCTDYDGVTMTRGWLAMLYRTDLALPPMKMVIGLDDDTGWSEPRPPGYTNKGAMHVNQGGACYYNLIIRSGWLEMWYRNDYLLTADQGAFNIYVADKPTTVTGMGAPFVSPDDDASQAIFKIYVFDGDLGKTTLIGLSDIVDVEPGASWCESGDMEVGLEPGRLYAIGVVWTGQAQIEGALPISSLSREVVGVPAGSSLVSSPAEEQVGDQVFSAVKADKIYPMLIELEKAPVDVTPAVLDDSLY